MPTQSFRATARTSVPVEEAWAGLQHPRTWEGIAGVDHVTGATHHDGRLTGFDFATTVAGMRYPGRSTVTRVDPPVHMRLELTTSELTATIDVALRAAHTETDVDVEMTVQTRSFLAGMLFPAIAETIGRGLPAAATDFARLLAESDRR